MEGKKIQRVAVIGAGLMGHGIALEFSASGRQVQLYDDNPEVLDGVSDRIGGSLRIMLEAGLLDDQDRSRVLANTATCLVLEDAVADADLVVEAIAEDLVAKREVFRRIDASCPSDAVLASNTSTFMPSQLAAATETPARVLVTHYFNPPFLLPLVEIVRSPNTADAVVDAVYDLLVDMGKAPVVVQKEVRGFIGNRIQAAVLREALALVEQDVATPAEIDTVIKTSIGRRWATAGVFEVAEIAGLDLKLAIVEQLFPCIASGREVSSLLRDKVADGHLGFKTGKGFYDWTPETAEALRSRVAQALIEIAGWTPRHSE